MKPFLHFHMLKTLRWQGGCVNDELKVIWKEGIMILQDTNAALAWREWRKPRKPSVGMAGLLTEIRNHYLLNSK
jgi:hypothetical protein